MTCDSHGGLRRPLLVTSALAATLTLAACGSGSGGGDAQPVDAGAGKEDYVAAFADLDAKELVMQVPFAPGSYQSKPYDDYAAAVAEWSGGKLTFDIQYSNARVPYDEMADALREGLVDVGIHAYTDQREALPISAGTTDLMYLHDGSPVLGNAQLMATWIEYGQTADAARQELTESGIQPLVPFIAGSSATLLCNEPVTSLASAADKLVRPTSALIGEEVTALGASLVDVDATESFDALQRGSLDCFTASPSSATAFGLYEAANHWTLDNDLMLPAGATAFNFSKSSWDSLPLQAQQLLTDKLDVYIAAYMTSIYEGWAQAFEQVDEFGVTIHEAEQDLIDALASFRETAQSDQAESDLDAETAETARDIHEQWRNTLTELGFTDETTWDEFPTWLESSDLDFTEVADTLMETGFSQNRPS